MVRSGGVGIGYLRPDQFLDHLTVIKIKSNISMPHSKLVDAIYTIGSESHQGKEGTTKNVYWSSFWLHCLFWEENFVHPGHCFHRWCLQHWKFPDTTLTDNPRLDSHLCRAHKPIVTFLHSKAHKSKKATRSQPSNQPSIQPWHPRNLSLISHGKQSKQSERRSLEGKGDQAHLEGRESADGNRRAQACLRAILVFSCH